MSDIQRVVVIEDAGPVLRLMEGYLRDKGVCVASTSEGLAGIRLVSRRRPDLVICDHSVGETSGLHVLKTLKRNPETAVIPFIYMSSDVSASVRAAANRLGANAFLAKPFGLAQIDAALAEVR